MRFNFGDNWLDYSQNKLSVERIEAAVESLEKLLGEGRLKDQTFLDVGSGSGLFSMAAAIAGSKQVCGFDISPQSLQAAERNLSFMDHFGPEIEKPEYTLGSILNPEPLLEELGSFDVVYAWGVLQFTGEMWKAVENTGKFVREDGIMVLAVYNRHWSSPLWKVVKYIYNVVPKSLKKLMAYKFAVIIYIAKLLVTGKNPLRKERGMDFWYDVIDWLGGYPYEYYRYGEIKEFVEGIGFEIENSVMPAVPTGCIEFVLRKVG